MFVDGEDFKSVEEVRDILPSNLKAYIADDWDIYLVYKNATESHKYLFVCRRGKEWLTCFHDPDYSDAAQDSFPKICQGSLNGIIHHLNKCAENGTACDHFGRLIQNNDNYVWRNTLRNTLQLAQGLSNTDVFRQLEPRPKGFEGRVYGRTIDL